jgi:hypothetical protein
MSVPSATTIADIVIPDTASVRDVTAFIREAEDDLLFHHSRRVFLVGALQGLPRRCAVRLWRSTTPRATKSRTAATAKKAIITMVLIAISAPCAVVRVAGSAAGVRWSWSRVVSGAGRRGRP